MIIWNKETETPCSMRGIKTHEKDGISCDTVFFYAQY